MRLAAHLLAAVLAVGCSSKTEGTTSAKPDPPPSAAGLPKEADVAELRKLLLAYKTAIYDKNGEAAAKQVSKKTIAYFEDVRAATLKMPEEELRKKPMMHRLMVLMLRARMTVDQLKTMDGRGLFVHAVNEGWVGQEGRDLEPAEVKIEGDAAQIGITSHGATLPPAAGFDAFREDGVWKLEVMSVGQRPTTVKAAEDAFKKVDPDPDVAIVKTIGMVVGKEIGPEIWKPLEP